MTGAEQVQFPRPRTLRTPLHRAKRGVLPLKGGAERWGPV